MFSFSLRKLDFSVSDAVWVTDSIVAAIDDRGELVSCDTAARCIDVRAVTTGPIEVGRVWLVAPLAEGGDAVPPAPHTLAPDGLWTVQMVSPTTVFAGGPNAFLRSDDGGATWHPMLAAHHVEQIDMLDATTGWVVTDEGLPEAKGQRYVLRAGAFFEIAGGLITRVTTYYNLADWTAQVVGKRAS